MVCDGARDDKEALWSVLKIYGVGGPCNWQSFRLSNVNRSCYLVMVCDGAGDDIFVYYCVLFVSY